jgi:hypothetical protein
MAGFDTFFPNYKEASGLIIETGNIEEIKNKSRP